MESYAKYHPAFVEGDDVKTLLFIFVIMFLNQNDNRNDNWSAKNWAQ
jgi:hypothetical protein